MKIIYNVIVLTVAILLHAKLYAQQTNKPTVQLDHVAIYVVNLQQSAYFYQQILGLDTVPEPFHDKKHMWLQIAPQIQMHIIQGAEKFKAYYKNNHFCFSVTSLQQFTDKLKQKNIAWEDRDGQKQALTTRVDGVQQLWLQDPDGYWIEVNNAKH